ncbi:MAG: hypothetical protein NVS1B13_25190 [Flavisolibacter sp.]
MEKQIPLQDVFKNAGYFSDYDNRNKHFKSLNDAYKSGNIKIIICEKGNIYRDNNGNRYNIAVSGFGWKSQVYAKTSLIKPIDILCVLARLLKLPQVKAAMDLHFSYKAFGPCPKCSGHGYIPCFKHVADGVCFSCYGRGITEQTKTVTVKKESKNESI